MKDSLKFCIQFIKEIEKNPQLYDHRLTDYSNRRVTEVIWAKIAAKFDESENDCRIKWKAIRSSYIRSLNTRTKSGSDAGSKKKYYLAQYLRFLIPFTKNRPQEYNRPIVSPHINENTDDSPIDLKFSEESERLVKRPACTGADADEKPIGRPATPINSPSHIDSGPNAPRKKILSEVDQCIVEYFNLKKKRFDSAQTEPRKDACEMFLLSMVPHVKSMTHQQQFTFQKGVLQLIENIKYQ